LASGAISKTVAQQSILTKLYKDLGDNTGKTITLPPNSITTVVMDYEVRRGKLKVNGALSI